MEKQQAGFTLIELVMVIVILGILSAFALPKFADLSDNAVRAAAENALGTVKSAAGITHAAYLADGSVATTITLEGTTANIINGYPASNSIAALANITNGQDFTVVVSNSGTGTGTAVFTTLAAASSACSFQYTEAGVNGAPTFSSVNSCP